MKYLIPLALILATIIFASCNRKTAKSVTKTKTPTPPIAVPPPPLKPTLAIDGQDHGMLMISIERSPCNGTCPWFVAKVYEDGAIFYNGKKHTRLKGEQAAVTNIPTLNSLIRRAEEIGFFDMAAAYPIKPENRIADFALTTITIRSSANKENKVQYSNDQPADLTNYSNELDAFLDKQNFRPLFEKAVPEKIDTPDGKDHGTLQLTIEKMPCYGSCPWYEASFYDDGTIFYTGKKNVEHLGSYRMQSTPAMIRSLTKNAKAMGFFKLNKQYPVDPKNAIPDLPKVQIMVKDGRSKKSISYQNEAPEQLKAFTKEVEAVLMRQSFKKIEK